MIVGNEDGVSHSGQPSNATSGASQNLPKRFYKTAEWQVEGDGFAVCLDGRSIRTPLKNKFILPTEALAAKIAEEWQSQGAHIDPEAMPLAKLANTALDHVGGKEAPIIDDIVAFAASDLLCYRAEGPEGLVAAQKKHWDPVLDWFAASHGAHFIPVEGIVHVSQPDGALSVIRSLVTTFDLFRLTALHTITTLTGSALLAVALGRGQLSEKEAWRAAHVDEDFQITKWGTDDEAEARREKRWVEMSVLHNFSELAGAG